MSEFDNVTSLEQTRRIFANFALSIITPVKLLFLKSYLEVLRLWDKLQVHLSIDGTVRFEWSIM